MVPNSSILPQHPQGGTSQGRKYTDQQKYVSQDEKPRTYIDDKATVVGGDDPFKFYSKYSKTNLKYDADNDSLLEQRYNTSDFKNAEVFKDFIGGVSSSLDYSKSIRNRLVENPESDAKTIIDLTGEDPNIEGKIPVVTRPKLTEKEKQLPYSDLGNVKKYSNILMSPSEFHGKESP